MAKTRLDTFLEVEDALANHFQVIIPAFPGVLGLPRVNLRVKTIDIPDTEIATYEVTKGGKKATRRAGIQGSPNEFSLTYVVDRNYEVYDSFEAWSQAIHNDLTGTQPLPESALRIPIQVIGKDANGNITTSGWTFRGCFISSHSGISFDEENGDPLEASVTIQYIDKIKTIASL